MTSIGTTNDGLIFMIISSQIEGKPVETTIQWSLEQARKVVETITEKCEEAEKIKRGD